VLPLAQIVTAMYGYAVTVAIMLALCPLLHVTLGTATLLLIPGTLLLVALTCGFVLVNSGLHVYFRDIRYFVSAATMLLLYVTPIIYRPEDVHGPLQTVINLNPMTGVVDLFHAATVGHVGSTIVPITVTSAWAFAFFAFGTFLHCRFNRVFADLL
jgi:ABC-type polysaccharide/polyol phosphate export permease